MYVCIHTFWGVFFNRIYYHTTYPYPGGVERSRGVRQEGRKVERRNGINAQKFIRLLPITHHHIIYKYCTRMNPRSLKKRLETLVHHPSYWKSAESKYENFTLIKWNGLYCIFHISVLTPHAHILNRTIFLFLFLLFSSIHICKFLMLVCVCALTWIWRDNIIWIALRCGAAGFRKHWIENMKLNSKYILLVS